MSYLLLSTLGFCTVCVAGIVGFSLHIVWVRRKYRFIPGPPITSFFLGHAAPIVKLRKKGVYHSDLILEWAKLYGPVFKMLIFNKCMVQVVSPAGVKEILTKSKHLKCDRVYKRLFNSCGTRFFGRGLVTNLDHTEWAKRRGAVNPAFHKRHLKSLIDTFNLVADQWIKKLSALADGITKVSMADLCQQITVEMIARLAYSENIGAVEDKDSEFLYKCGEALKGLAKSARNPFFQYDPRNWSFVKAVQESARYVRKFGKKLITKRIRDIQKGQQVPTDFLSCYLDSAKAVPTLTMEDLVDEFVTIFTAGSETTANVMSFLMGEVGRNPAVLSKLEAEIDSVLGNNDSVSYDDIGRLEYMNQVWQETLRLYPTAPATVRKITEDVTIDGVTIPADTSIIVPFYVIHRLPQYYEEPTKFDPDRFAPQKEREMFTYLPFSIGQRSCAGKQFAQIEAKILLSKFFKTFRFELDPDQSFGIVEETTLRPKGGTQMTLTLKQT